MSNTYLPLILSILSALIFLVSILIAGEIYPGYNHLHQFISELGASNFVYASWINYLAFIFSGSILLLAIIMATAHISETNTQARLGKFGLGWYAFGLIFSGVFPCDLNCSLDAPSNLQIIHSVMGWISYFMGILGVFLLSPLILKQLPKGPLSKPVCKTLGCIAAAAFVMLNFNLPMPGLWQRVLEVSVFSWIILYMIQLNTSLRESV